PPVRLLLPGNKIDTRNIVCQRHHTRRHRKVIPPRTYSDDIRRPGLEIAKAVIAKRPGQNRPRLGQSAARDRHARTADRLARRRRNSSAQADRRSRRNESFVSPDVYGRSAISVAVKYPVHATLVRD